MENIYESRFLSDNELLYNITNSKQLATDAQLCNDEMIDLDKIFAALTPGRQKVAIAAVELYKRMQARKEKRLNIRCSRDIYNIMMTLLNDLPNEEFWVLSLNNNMKMLKKTRLSFGGIDQTCVDIRLVMRELILVGAVAFVVVHNHPSGYLKPSEQDKRITEALLNAGKAMNIKLTDHVIIGGDGYYSFSDEGII